MKIEDLLDKWLAYQPLNPVTSTEMPDKEKIEQILYCEKWGFREDIREKMWGSLFHRRTQIEKYIEEIVWESAKALMWRSLVVDSIRNSSAWKNGSGESMWKEMWHSQHRCVRVFIWSSPEAFVRYYCAMIGYYAVTKFFNSAYRHPVYDIIDMGVFPMWVYTDRERRKGEYLIYGKDGILLGKTKEGHPHGMV
jgi:hypothetical protein